MTDNTMRDKVVNAVVNISGKKDKTGCFVSSATCKSACHLLWYLYLPKNRKVDVCAEGGDITISISKDERTISIICKHDKYMIRKQEKDGSSMFYAETIEDIHKVCNAVKLFFGNPMKKACLFTGAFNPPTLAHFHMVDSAVDAGGFDYIIFAASNQKFLDKKQAKSGGYAYSEKERMDLLNIMLKDVPNALVFGIEEGYTYNVLCAVNECYRPEELYFALGSDKLVEIDRWGYHDKLLKEFGFYVRQRQDDMDYIEEQCCMLFKDTKFIVGTCNEKYKDISATQVRDAITKGKTYKHLVTNSVYRKLQTIKKGADGNET